MEKLLKHDYVTPRLKSSLQKFYSRHHVLIDRYKISSSWTDWPLQNIVIMNWLTVTKYCHHELIDRYKISSSCTDWPLQNIVIMNWLTVTKIPYLKWQWIFSLLHIICLSSIDYCRQDFYWTWLYIWVTQRVSYNKQKLLTHCEYLSSTGLSGVEHVAHILVFCVVFFSFCLSSYCVQCCLCLWIVHSWLFLWFTQMFIPGDFTSSIPLE
jgi:hypothetical protein